LIPIIFSASTTQLVSLTKHDDPTTPEPVQNIKVAPGFAITAFKHAPANNPTSIIFGPDNNLYMANYNGDIWGISTKDGTSWKYVTGFNVPVGLAWYNDELYVASLGKVSIVHDENKDNIGDRVEDIITGLPAGLYHWHANNGPVFGPDNRIYFSVGSTTDHSPETYQYAAAILSAEPDGSDLRVFATGVRNPYRLAFNSKGDLFATDNGPNALDETPADELNHIVEGGDYGYPNEFGIPSPGSNTQPPVVLFPPHASADGLIFYHGDQFPEEYYDNAFVALLHKGQIYRIQFSQDANGNYVTRLSVFVSGLESPLDLAVGPDGSLYVTDYLTNSIYKIDYVGEN
jgi:glucose/arabinose dehydrogenase